ncbi:MAG: NAD-binding protein [Gammaproteobacteria bacterium]|nr:NAD-binding protein [Gammaproteobacteria bacterium]
MKRAAVHFCYRLEASSRYKRIKGLFYDLLENPHSAVRPYFDSSMILVVLSSVFLLIFSVKHPLPTWADLFQISVVLLFTIEYLLRFWLHDDLHRLLLRHHEESELLDTQFSWGPLLREAFLSKWRFVSSPFAIIDLLAILPSYRPLRILRIFLLFRLFKLFRYTRSLGEFSQILVEKRFEFYTLAIFMGFVLFAASTAIFLFEGHRPDSDIQSIYDGFYWALVTLSTVGYGDLTPHTTEGRVVAMALIISGIGVLSFATSIIVSAFTDKMALLREHRVLGEIERGRRFTLICGYGRLGEQVAERLSRDKTPIVIVDSSEAAVEQARLQGYLALCGNATGNKLLEDLRIADRIDTLLCLTDDDVANVYLTLTARSLNPDLHIIARANRDENGPKLEIAGANRVVKPYQSIAAVAAAYVHQPVASEAMYGLIGGSQNLVIDTITIPESDLPEPLTMAQIDLSRHHLNLFGVVDHSGRTALVTAKSFDWGHLRFYFNPPADFQLQAGDVLVVFGPQHAVYRLKDGIEQNLASRSLRAAN